MFGHSFYYSTIRKYVSLMGVLFDDIVIERQGVPFSANTIDTETFDPTANVGPTQIIKVPVTYAARDKMVQRVIEDPNLDRPTAVTTLPLMSFELTSIAYDPVRKMETTARSAWPDPSANNQLRYQYAPVPYNLQFTLSIFVKNTEDGAKIVEHVLPFFTPEWTTTCVMIPELNVREDVSVVLHEVSCKDSYDGEYVKRRAIVWDLNFTLKGRFWGPTKRGPIIEFIEMPLYAATSVANLQSANGTTTIAEYGGATVQVQPGLTANGLPTSVLAQSVNTNLIQVTSDYGFIETITNQE